MLFLVTSQMKILKFDNITIICVSYVEMKSLITHSESLQSLSLLRRLNFMSKKTNGYLWAETHKIRLERSTYLLHISMLE